MNDRIKWLNNNNKKILFLDFSDSTAEESTRIWTDVESEMVNYNGSQPLLVLLNVKNVKYNSKTQNAYRGVRQRSKTVPQKWAIVNASTATKVMIKILCVFIKDNISFTDSIEEAKETLTKV